jgi:hypothetical protein
VPASTTEIIGALLTGDSFLIAAGTGTAPGAYDVERRVGASAVDVRRAGGEQDAQPVIVRAVVDGDGECDAWRAGIERGVDRHGHGDGIGRTAGDRGGGGRQRQLGSTRKAARSGPADNRVTPVTRLGGADAAVGRRRRVVVFVADVADVLEQPPASRPRRLVRHVERPIVLTEAAAVRYQRRAPAVTSRRP